MKSLRYIPFAFLCGVHGFALFAPYVMVFVLIMLLARRSRPVLVPIAAR